MTVRTRFAPSPTGYLHIGGVRTALFNWLFARHHKGQFILRIDDTDQKRNVEEALEPILSGFRWLGIDWDEGPEVGGPHGPYYQSQRADKYRAAVEKLLASGHAYRDYSTTDDIKKERDAAQKEKRSFLYSRKWMAETPEKQKEFEDDDRQSVVRLKMPREGTLEIDDLVRGKVEFEWAREQDHVIQRTDESCLYHLATVVDDHDMQISHVIRAEEHLSNTPRQIFIAQSLGYELPQFAHLPYVAEPGSKNKLSKRKLKKYLKNPSFRSLYDHGTTFATVQHNRINDFAKSKGTTASEENRNQFIKQLLDRLPKNVHFSDDPKEQQEMEDLIEDNIFAIFTDERFLDHHDLFQKMGIMANPEIFNPVIIDFFKLTGYLPDAILNYLLLLGWSFDDKREDFSRKEMIEHFSLERVNKAPASFDPAKLMAFQQRYMLKLPLDEKINMVLEFLLRPFLVPRDTDQPFLAPYSPTPEVRQRVKEILEAAGDRIKTACDILKYVDLFVEDDKIEFDDGDFNKHLRKLTESAELLGKFKEKLKQAHPFDAENLDKLLHSFVESEGIKMGKIIHALRVAVTGKAVGFGLFETLAILGKESCLCRIESALSYLQPGVDDQPNYL